MYLAAGTIDILSPYPRLLDLFDTFHGELVFLRRRPPFHARALCLTRPYSIRWWYFCSNSNSNSSWISLLRFVAIIVVIFFLLLLGASRLNTGKQIDLRGSPMYRSRGVSPLLHVPDAHRSRGQRHHQRTRESVRGPPPTSSKWK